MPNWMWIVTTISQCSEKCIKPKRLKLKLPQLRTMLLKLLISAVLVGLVLGEDCDELPVCPEDHCVVTFAHPTKDYLYYMCWNTIPVLQECPPNWRYNAQKAVRQSNILRLWHSLVLKSKPLNMCLIKLFFQKCIKPRRHW